MHILICLCYIIILLMKLSLLSFAFITDIVSYTLLQSCGRSFVSNDQKAAATSRRQSAYLSSVQVLYNIRYSVEQTQRSLDRLRPAVLRWCANAACSPTSSSWRRRRQERWSSRGWSEAAAAAWWARHPHFPSVNSRTIDTATLSGPAC